MGEERFSSRNVRLPVNGAFVRSALLPVLERHLPDRSRLEIRAHLHSRPRPCLTLLDNT